MSGDSQRVTVGTPFALPLIAAAYDANSKPVPGVAITFLASDAGTFSSSTATTDAAGRVQVTYTPGKVAGPVIVSASAPSLLSAAFDLTAAPAPPSDAAKSSGDQQAAAAGTVLATPFMVHVLDQYGNAVSGAAVTWTASAGASFTKTDQVTDNNGDAKAFLKLGNTPGVETVTAHVAGVTDVVFTATAQ
ncbi:MAG TPA: Ig-like domain-containing protein [Gemmatimonadales bacterium]